MRGALGGAGPGRRGSETVQDWLLERRERRLERGQPPDFEARCWARGLEPKAGRRVCSAILASVLWGHSRPSPRGGRWHAALRLRGGGAGVLATCALPPLGALGVRLFQRARSRVFVGESQRAPRFSVREGFVRLRGFGGSCALTTLVQPGDFALRLITQSVRSVVSSAVCLVSVWGGCSPMFR